MHLRSKLHFRQGFGFCWAGPEDIVLVKMDREQNGTPYCLAIFGRSDASSACLVRHVPDRVSQLVLADCNLFFRTDGLDCFNQNSYRKA